jgi:hypothetical protein
VISGIASGKKLTGNSAEMSMERTATPAHAFTISSAFANVPSNKVKNPTIPRVVTSTSLDYSPTARK